jgi:hypothetical protein
MSIVTEPKMREHVLVRAELRTSLVAASTAWDPERRRRYQLRDGTVPASADRKVWPAGDSIEVAITVLGADAIVLQRWLGEAELRPFQVQGWSALGYDVCDSTLTSGLLNCGYAPGESASLTKLWGEKLNRWHLFDQVEHAFGFSIVTNDRVPEHSPFGVFGVYVSASIDLDTTWREAVRLGTGSPAVS